MTNRIQFPQWSQKLVDPDTGLATRDFYRFLQELWLAGVGTDTVSVIDLQIQDSFDGLPAHTEATYSHQFLMMGG